MVTNFYLDKRIDKLGESPIIVSVSIKGTRFLSTVGYNISPECWRGNKAKQGTKTARGIQYNIINARLKSIDAAFENLAATIDHKPTKDELANILAEIKGVERKAGGETESIQQGGLLSYFDEFVREESRANQWTPGTMQCMAAFRNHLKAQKAKGFEHFNEKGIISFVSYLRTTAGMRENTVQKHYRNLRWFLNWCISKGYCHNGEISQYKPKFKVLEKPVIFLTKDELMRLYNFKVPSNGTKVKLTDPEGKEYEKTISDAGALEKTRDLFCFCAFTSLRYSDMAKLKKTDREGNVINVVTKKTNDKLIIPLNDLSTAILDKYKDVDFPKGLALPVISNQRMNDYIKDLGELCGFNEPITRVCFRAGEKQEETQPKWALLGTHAGRRTFICYALSVGISPQVVMKFTGHSDYKAMKPYIDIAEETKAKAMELFNNSMKG